MPGSKSYADTKYLKVVEKLLQQNKQRTYKHMRLAPGQVVLDVGCGSGSDTIRLAQIVGPRGRVIGVDREPQIIAEANDRAIQANVNAWVTHRQADATALPFDDNVFDACRSERLFQNLHHPEQALAEMARVTKSGSWVIVLDTDWGTLSVDVEMSELDIERRLARFKAERLHPNGFSGRQLYRLFRRQGLLDIEIEMLPAFSTNSNVARMITQSDLLEREALQANVVTVEEIERWHASRERADAEGTTFGSATQVLVAGRKP